MTAVPVPPSTTTVSSPPQLLTRYHDAYLTARATNGLGMAVKGIGIILGVFIAIVGAAAGNQLGGGAVLISMIIGATTGLYGYVAGVLLSAQGQILKASLDTAVNSSPFLNNQDRLRMMALDTSNPQQAGSPAPGPAPTSVGVRCVVCGTPLTGEQQRVFKGKAYCDTHFGQAIS